MSRKGRFAKAMFRRLDSMKDSEAAAALPIQEEPSSAPDEPELPPDPPFSKRQPFTPPLPTTILAEGSVFEGTLTTKGNIDMACTFKGNIFSEGSITMRHELEGNVQAVNIDLSSCTVTGDLRASEGVRLDEDSQIFGNIDADHLQCAGRITGDINARGHVLLAASAILEGNLTAATLSVEEGAALEGTVTVRRSRQ